MKLLSPNVRGFSWPVEPPGTRSGEWTSSAALIFEELLPKPRLWARCCDEPDTAVRQESLDALDVSARCRLLPRNFSSSPPSEERRSASSVKLASSMGVDAEYVALRSSVSPSQKPNEVAVSALLLKPVATDSNKVKGQQTRRLEC